jgi:hypothetical protein
LDPCSCAHLTTGPSNETDPGRRPSRGTFQENKQANPLRLNPSPTQEQQQQQQASSNPVRLSCVRVPRLPRRIASHPRATHSLAPHAFSGSCFCSLGRRRNTPEAARAHAAATRHRASRRPLSSAVGERDKRQLRATTATPAHQLPASHEPTTTQADPQIRYAEGRERRNKAAAAAACRPETNRTPARRRGCSMSS